MGRAAGWPSTSDRFEPREQLGAFFEDRQVGGEVGVEHGVEAQPPQGGDHLAGDQRAGRIAETLAQGGADGRRGLHDDVLVRLVQGLPDLVDLVLLGDRAHRADGRALAALHAGHRAQVAVEGRADDRLEAAVLGPTGRPTCCVSAQTLTQRRHLMHLPLSRTRAGVEVSIRLRVFSPGIGYLADAQLGGQGLQFAVLVAVAGLALAVVLGEQQFDDHAGGPRARGGCWCRPSCPG